jgi:hypothetical protein
LCVNIYFPNFPKTLFATFWAGEQTDQRRRERRKTVNMEQTSEQQKPAVRCTTGSQLSVPINDSATPARMP